MLLIKSFNSIENTELKSYWKDLYQTIIEGSSMSHPFLFNHYEWNKSWLLNLKNDKDKFTCIVVKKENKPILIIPLILKKVLSMNFAQLIGGKETDYQNILINKVIYLNNKNLILEKLKKTFNEKKICYFKNKSITDSLTISLITMVKTI